jgi:hypothetical protein
MMILIQNFQKVEYILLTIGPPRAESQKRLVVLPTA